MTTANPNYPTRQLYAAIREDIYLAAKARATEMRVPLRLFVENALRLALKDMSATSPTTTEGKTVWEDEYLAMQARQPLGSPVQLTDTESIEVIRSAFASTDRT